MRKENYRLLRSISNEIDRKSLQESENHTTINETKESKTMTKYEIIEDTFEIRQTKPHDTWTEQEIEDGYYRDGNMDGRTIGSYATLDEATAAFKGLEPDTWEDHGCAFWFIHGTVYTIVENEYDEDGEYIEGTTIEMKVKEFKE